MFFCFKQKSADEVRISDWSSDVCSSDLGEVPADRDFVLAWAPEASAAPQAALFAEQVGSDAHLLVMMVPPSASVPASDARPLPRELVFIIDTSGSMHGDSLDQAKAAVIAALKRLTDRKSTRLNSSH